MEDIVELAPYEKPDQWIAVKRSAIDEIVPISGSRTDIRLASGRCVALYGNFRIVLRRVGNFVVLEGEREDTPQILNPENVEQVEQTSEGWCRLYMASGRSCHVKGSRIEVCIKIHAALTGVSTLEPQSMISLTGLGPATVSTNDRAKAN